MTDEGSSLATLRTIADYQFGAGTGPVFFPADEDLQVERSRSGRPRQVIADGGRIVTYTTSGRFTLGAEGGRRLRTALSAPGYRVVVGEESEPFVRDGKNAFAKFVRGVDPVVRRGDEVLVVTADDDLLGVGRAELGADAMEDFDRGMAVEIREGVPE